jgi:hypothetical protein
MKLVRGIERRLERLVEGVAGRVFRGSLHPVEMAARLLREADLAAVDTEKGPIVPNEYAIQLNEHDTAQIEHPDRLNRELEAAIDETAVERGWRLEGPTRVWLETSPTVGQGRLGVITASKPGQRREWARLRSAEGTFPITLNRSTVGRGEGCDVRIPIASVSRSHCMIWMESGNIWVADLRSANGTFVNGASATKPVLLQHGDSLVLGSTPLAFEVV